MRSTGSWYELRSETGELWKGRLRGKFKMQGLKVTNPIAVGDWVDCSIEDESENTVNINDIRARENYIIRKSVHKTAHGHLIAANIDQAILIATLTKPRTSLGFIDRFLVSSESFRIPTCIIFNKTDLLDEEELAYQQDLCAMYASIGYPALQTSVAQGVGLEEFRNLLSGKISLLSGHSGVGKSSLVNQIAPHLALKTSEISDYANKGVHTTTFAEMFLLNDESFIIDTPGIKELGLIDMEVSEIGHYFPEMRDLLGECRYHNCLHVNEPQCAVKEAVEAGKIALTRYESYLSMLDNDDNRR